MYDLEFLSLTVLESCRRAWTRRHEFLSFGAVCVAPELVPIAGLLFRRNKVVASAFWVAEKIEEAEKKALRAGSATTVEELVIEYTEQEPLITGRPESSVKGTASRWLSLMTVSPDKGYESMGI